MISDFTVISTFCGAGGSSLGYKMAGGKVLLSIEWEKNACQTYRLNHPDTCLLNRDIATVSASEIFNLTGLKLGELDILDGSPPCQGFSTMGKRQVQDPRNRLFQEYVRLLQELRPKVFVMENVSGLVKGRMKPVFVEILQALKRSGYQVKAQLMDAQYYQVPQRRKRVIWIGVREDLGMCIGLKIVPRQSGRCFMNIPPPLTKWILNPVQKKVKASVHAATTRIITLFPCKEMQGFEADPLSNVFHSDTMNLSAGMENP